MNTSLTSKQRAHLRALANKLSPTHYVGRAGITPEFNTAVDEALQSRELIKLGVQAIQTEDIKSLAETLAGRTRSQVVSVVGNKFTLYRKHKTNPTITLPK